MRPRCLAPTVVSGLARSTQALLRIMRHVLLHGHIFKNAGTTFDWSLARSFGAAFLDHRNDKAMREQRGKHLASLIAERTDLKAVSSHFLCYPLPVMDAVEFHSIFLLRHPIERIASVYAFERKQEADTRGAKAAKEKTFAEYVAWRLDAGVPRTIRDYQTGNITGGHDHAPAQDPPPTWLSIASDRLLSLTGAGVVDRYDDSMIVLEAALKPTFPTLDLAYVRQNVSQVDAQDSIEARVESTLERLGDLAGEILRQNSFDLALYRQANLRLDAALADLTDLAERRADFDGRCKALREKKWWRRS